MISIARSLGAPVIDPPGNAARSRSSASTPGVEIADDGRDQMVDRGVALEREELGDAHRARRADARQVVAHQVDDHQVLGAILGALGQRLARARASCSGPTPRGRVPLIGRVSTWPRGVDAQEALGRRAEHRRIGQVEERGERRRRCARAGASRASTAARRAAPRTAATGSPGRCRRRRCTRARARRRRGSRRA